MPLENLLQFSSDDRHGNMHKALFQWQQQCSDDYMSLNVTASSIHWMLCKTNQFILARVYNHATLESQHKRMACPFTLDSVNQERKKCRGWLLLPVVVMNTPSLLRCFNAVDMTTEKHMAHKKPVPIVPSSNVLSFGDVDQMKQQWKSWIRLKGAACESVNIWWYYTTHLVIYWVVEHVCWRQTDVWDAIQSFRCPCEHRK